MTMARPALGRPLPRPVLPRSDRGVAAVLALLAVAVRLPFRADFLTNWDSVNFALGVTSFDLATHQPHPPGYLGWVELSRAATWLTSDPNAAMTLLSAISGAVATALAYLLARRFVGRRASLIVALLFSTAPLVWYYSVVALSYMTTGAVAMGLLLALVIAVQERSPRALLVASVLLAVVGALRPTDEAMLFPAWAFVTLTFGWRDRIRATAVMGVLSLAWVVPLLWLSGGVGAFAGEGSAVADLAGGRTWVLGGNLTGFAQNLGMVGAGLVLGIFGGLAVLVLARVRGVHPFGGLARDERRLLIAWVALPLFVYTLLHTGQLGYVILLLPVAYVGVARAVPRLPQAVRDHAARRRARGHTGLRRPTVTIAGLLALNTLAFLVLPPAGLSILERSAQAAAEQAESEDVGQGASVNRTRQYDVVRNDRHWRSVIGLIGRYDPETTAVVTETSSAGSFRHLSYYAPDHNLYGFGWDRTGDLGFLFHARDRNTTYGVDKLAHAHEAALLPTEVRTLVVTDAMLIDRWDDTPMARMERLQIKDGTWVGLVHLTAPGAVMVENPETEDDGTLAEGFPSSSDSDETEEEQAEVRIVPARQITEAHPAPDAGGTLP
jgi:MFS family permease